MGAIKAGSQRLFAVDTQDTSRRKPVTDQGQSLARRLRTLPERSVLAKKQLPWHLLLGS